MILTKEMMNLFREFEGRDAIVKIYGVTYEAHDIEIVGEYLIFQDKFNRRTLVNMSKIISIAEMGQEKNNN